MRTKLVHHKGPLKYVHCSFISLISREYCTSDQFFIWPILLLIHRIRCHWFLRRDRQLLQTLRFLQLYQTFFQNRWTVSAYRTDWLLLPILFRFLKSVKCSLVPGLDSLSHMQSNSRHLWPEWAAHKLLSQHQLHACSRHSGNHLSQVPLSFHTFAEVLWCLRQ